MEWDKNTRRIVLIGLAAAVIAVGLAAVGFLEETKRSDFWLEVGKAGIQLGVIVIAGGAVTFGFKLLESQRADRAKGLEAERAALASEQELERAERRRRDEYLLDVLRQLIEAYHEVKAVRRTLCAYGFCKPGSDDGRPAGWDELAADRVEQFRLQMSSLVKAQLELEQIERTFTESDEQNERTFSDADTVKDLIHKAQSYVNRIIDDWEARGVEVVVGADARVTTDTFPRLQGILGAAGGEGGIKNLSEQITRSQRLIQVQLLGQQRQLLDRPSSDYYDYR